MEKYVRPTVFFTHAISSKMHSTTKTPATFALLSILGFASAGCSSGGIVADAVTMNAAREDAQLDTTCSFLVGEYALHEQRYTCIEIGGSKYDLRLQYDAQPVVDFDHYTHEPDATRKIEPAGCMDGMKKELSCSRGGQSIYTDWRYKYVSTVL
jgi:hypothetical protein